MAKKTIKGFHDTNVVVKTSHTTITVDANATLMSGKIDPSGSAVGTLAEDFSIMPIPSHNTFNINGEIIAYEIGVLTGGAHDTINIGKTADISGAVAVYAAGKQTRIENHGHLISNGFGSGVSAILAAGSNSRVQNDGLIEGLVGISAAGDHATVVNGADGVIRSVVNGVNIQSGTGDVSTFTNHGTLIVTASISGSGDAFIGGGGNDTVTNDGAITGAVMLGDGDDKLTNSGKIDGYVDLGDGTNSLDNHGGTITGSIVGGANNDTIVNTGKILGDFDLGDGINTINNHGGTISGDSIIGGADADKIINSGKMTADVDLGDGNDTFDGRGGHMTGSIIGGDGDDTLITDSAKLVLTEDSTGTSGNDTVKSTVSYTLTANVENLVLIGKANVDGTGLDTAADHITGNIGNNTLMGLGGSDDLSGGKGNDKLWGGADADTFHFSTGYGHDILEDFSQAEHDVIDLSHWTGMTNLAAVTNAAENQGADTLVTLGQDTLLIKNIHENQLTDADFVYSAT